MSGLWESTRKQIAPNIRWIQSYKQFYYEIPNRYDDQIKLFWELTLGG